MNASGALALPNDATIRCFDHGSVEMQEMPACRDHLFACRLAGTVEAERKLSGRWGRAVTRRGSITVVPAGQDSAWRLHGAGTILHLYLPPSLLRWASQDLPGAPGELAPADRLGAHDPRAASLVDSLVWEMRHGLAGSTLCAEAITTQIVVWLVRQHGAGRAPAAGKPSGLRGGRRRRLVDYVEANLHRDLSLRELADLAELGPSQFSANFRASFGSSPYRYVLRRRVERAKELLAGSELTIVQIALAVGFAHQSHLTTTFKRLCGDTPAAYRSRHGHQLA